MNSLLTVNDVMTKNVRVFRDTQALALVAAEMDSADVHHVPVVDADGRVTGIVSDRDLLRAFKAGSAQAEPVAVAMTRDVVTVSTTTPAHEAAQTMLAHHFSSLPVVDGQRKVVGIVTTRDFVEVAAAALEGKPLGR